MAGMPFTSTPNTSASSRSWRTAEGRIPEMLGTEGASPDTETSRVSTAGPRQK